MKLADVSREDLQLDESGALCWALLRCALCHTAPALCSTVLLCPLLRRCRTGPHPPLPSFCCTAFCAAEEDKKALEEATAELKPLTDYIKKARTWPAQPAQRAQPLPLPCRHSF